MNRSAGQPNLGSTEDTHREAIAAMDFFTVPTITFGVLYCFFVISHDRRRILHVNVTKHPTSGWIIQQLREAFPFEASHKYLILDRDQKFGFEVIAAVTATRMIPKRTKCPPVSPMDIESAQKK